MFAEVKGIGIPGKLKPFRLWVRLPPSAPILRGSIPTAEVLFMFFSTVGFSLRMTIWTKDPQIF